MLPVGKSHSNSYYTDTGFSDNLIPTEDDYSVYKSDTKTVFITSDDTTIEFAITEYPSGLSGGDRLLLTDNYTGSTTAYNKMYYILCKDDDNGINVT